MIDDNPLDHLPDPTTRYKVLAFTRGAEVYIEILDDVMKTGVVMDLRSALAVAGDINREAVRIVDVVGSQIDQGTIPHWKRFISQWGSHGEGTAEQNRDTRHALTC